ncbi:MAG: efflux RND transporter periplasmic adaptor subunit, partial [Chryseolinea sp.]
MKLYIIILAILMLTFSCKKKEHQNEAAEYYSCTMHTSVRSNKPGACPVCGMGLTKVKEKSESMEGNDSTMLTVSNEKQMLANIIVDTARVTMIAMQTTLTGKISADENKLTTISSQVPGRIDRLFVRQEGEHIVTGQALYSIYSEELLADQNDYLSALQQRNKFPGQQSTVDALIQGGRKKLLLWGMTESQ